MACLVHIECRARKESADQLLGGLREILPDTRCREGCASVSVTRTPDDPLNIVVVEPWDSRQHDETYFAWRQRQGVLDQLAARVDGGVSWCFFDIVGL